MEKRIVIIDGNSLINRAYYAMQRPMMTRDGIYTQGVYGFINMLSKIIKDYDPGYITVAFDRKAPTFRHLEYKEYKAGRKKMPDELAMQMPLLKEVLSAMNIKMLETDGFEADDIIGTVSVRAEQEGLEPLIITGDKDELQLATDKTNVLITRKGISEFDMYDKNAMIEKYGLTPERFIDLKGLMGDQSDNIPGIPGVGEKTATKLLLEYGSVEELIRNSDSIKSTKLREKIKENAHLALMSKKLATINTNVPIDFNINDFRITGPDTDALIKIYKKLEFNSFLKKLDIENANSMENDDALSAHYDKIIEERVLIDTEEVFEQMKEDITKTGTAFIKVLSDNGHIALPEVYGIGIMTTDTFYFIKGSDDTRIKEFFMFITNTDIQICGHGLIKDYYAFMALYPDVSDNACDTVFNTGFDTEIAAYLLDPSANSYSLPLLSKEYLYDQIEDDEKFLRENAQIDMFTDKSDIYSKYCAKWCVLSERLSLELRRKIADSGLEKVMREVELPLIEVLASMEVNGFGTDKNELEKTGKAISSRIEELASLIYGLAGEEFNINSPLQLGNILFEKLGLPAGKKTKKGYSTSADILEKLRDMHPIIDLILEYRTLTKLNGTYIEGLIPLIGSDGRIHAHFRQTVTATGRISCTEPNLQNIPVRQEIGREIRRAFIPQDKDGVLVGADYSQIELRVLANMSGDVHLIDAFVKGEDIHRSTASKVFNIPIDEVTQEERSAAKAVNFGVIYGMSSFGLSSEIHVSRKKAENYINEYFRRFPDVKRFMDDQIEKCRSTGYSETIMGRRRYIKEINASSFMVRQLGERLAMNTPIQGSAADIIKLAMIDVYRKLRKEDRSAKLILQVHDELIIETDEHDRQHVESILQECMEKIMEMKVRFTVSVNSGMSWYDLK